MGRERKEKRREQDGKTYWKNLHSLFVFNYPTPPPH
jgi:hypothetical protein